MSGFFFNVVQSIIAGNFQFLFLGQLPQLHLCIIVYNAAFYTDKKDTADFGYLIHLHHTTACKKKKSA